MKNSFALSQLKARLTRKIHPFDHTLQAILRMSDDDRAILKHAINSEKPAVTFQGNLLCPFCGSPISTEFQTAFNFGTGFYIYHCYHCNKLHHNLTALITQINNLDIYEDFPKILTIGFSLIKDLPYLDNGAAVLDFLKNFKAFENSVQTFKEHADLKILSPEEVAARLGVNLATAKKACENVAQNHDIPVQTLESQNNDTTPPAQYFTQENPQTPVNDSHSPLNDVNNTSSTFSLPPTNAEPNLEMEKFLLSSMLMKDGEIVPAVAAILQPDDFYRPEHRIIFKHLVNQFEKLSRTDFIALVEELRTAGLIEKIGTEFVFSLPQIANTTAFSEYYARILKAKADNRRVNAISSKIIADTRAGLKTPAQIIADATAEFEKINSAAADENLIDVAQYFSAHFQSFVNDNQKFADRKTGFSNIDAQFYNFKPGVYVLGGLPALGKTTFALQLLAQLADSGETCFFCSFEMEKGFLYAKLLAREVASIESQNFSTPDLIAKPLTAVHIANNNIYGHNDAYSAAIAKITQKPLPLYIWEIDEPNIDKLLARLKKICAALDKPPIVCIDYLQILAVGSENIKSSIDEVLHKIFAFRRKTNTTFIVVSSLNRANYNTEISFESFKESGSIEYSADVILGMQLYLKSPRTPADAESAKKENPRPVHIKFLKNRYGANFDCYFNYYPAFDYFEPCDESDFVEVDVPFNDTKPANSNAESDIGV